MSRIAAAFERARTERRAALVIYLTAGDPDLHRTRTLLGAVARGGADLIELGVPFSDPAADGPVLQAAAARALAAGTCLREVIDLVAAVRAGEIEDLPPELPLILFGYANPFLRQGEGLPARLAAAGVDGVLAVDLPPDSRLRLFANLQAVGVDPILLATPTTVEERLSMLLREARGFLYTVSLVGVTGAELARGGGITDRLDALRARAPVPVAVGFGVDGPEAVARLAPHCDGVVVGTALVRIIAEGGVDLEQRVEAFVRALRGACALS